MRGDESNDFAAHVAVAYRVEQEIGRGGWGLVYAAHDIRYNRKVAIKLLRGEFAGSASGERFKREIEILSRLGHPHIVELYDWGDFDGAPWYAMSFVEGDSLSQRLEREGPLPIVESLRIARCVADALDHAHAAGIVHRDIKPANILLRDGHVLVADFGIARAMSRESTLASISSSGLQIGTPAYMSPEQASAAKDIDGRSDIYSLGCVLYEMLTGAPPFSGSSSTALVARHVLDPVPPISTVRRSVSKAVEDVVYHALSKAPADRFKTAGEFAAALDAVAIDPSVSVVSARRRWRRVATATVAVAILLAGASRAWQASRAAGDARDVSAADTTRLVVFPFEQAAGALALPNGDQAFRRALLRWNGLQLVDPNVVHDAIEKRSGSVGSADARALALGLRAGRYVRASYSTAANHAVQIHAELFDVARQQVPLAEVTETSSLDAQALDSVLARITDRLLFRGEPSDSIGLKAAGTTSLPAQQAFLHGSNELQEWNLAAADSSFASATHFDSRFARASLWLALTRMWMPQPSTTWAFAAAAAAEGRASLTDSEREKEDALLALKKNDRPAACGAWDELTRRAPFDFTAWYGAGDCLARDRTVVRDARSITGWSFRSGYQAALIRFQRAFDIRPAILRALRDDQFARVRQLLWTSGSDVRFGTTGSTRPLTFVAYPSLDHDTLAFVPIPYDRFVSADPETMRKIPRTVSAAVLRERSLFHDVASAWAASNPQSAEAREAVAMSLLLLGEPSALDTLMHAKALAVDPRERQRVVEAEVWMRVQFALPEDLGALHRARLLADSLLHADGMNPVDAHTLASVAALTGHAFEAVRIERSVVSETQSSMTPVASLARSLAVYAAFGGPRDSLRALESQVETLIATAIPPEHRAGARAEALGRAAQIAFPNMALASVPSLAGSGSYLLAAEASWLRHDTSAVVHAMENVRRTREIFSPQLSFDGVYPEAWLVAGAGDTNGAIAWLDQLLVKLRATPSPIDPIHAAALVNAMALRAELAARAGDAKGAARWASPVVELWGGADAFLQPLVARMRQLAK